MRYYFSLFLLIPTLAFAESAEFTLFRSELIVTPGGRIAETEWHLTLAENQVVGLHRYSPTAMKSGEKPEAPKETGTGQGQRKLTGVVATLFYLPGTNMNGVLKTADSRHNLWLYLAERGVEVFAMDYRTRFIPHDFAGDLSFMRDWSMDLFVEDAVLAVNKVRQEQSAAPLYIAGFSRGASFAYALAGQVPAAGLIALDGSFKKQPYEPFDLAAALQRYDGEARFASVLSRRGYDARTDMMRRVISDPSSPAMDDRYQSAGEQLSETLYKAWGPGALTNARKDISPIETLATEMLAYDWFYPTIQDVERLSIMSQQDDPNTWIDDHFGEMTLPVLYFGSGKLGVESLLAGIHSAGRSGSEDVTIKVLEDYGHLDVLFANTAATEVYEVIYQWILERQANLQSSSLQRYP